MEKAIHRFLGVARDLGVVDAAALERAKRVMQTAERIDDCSVIEELVRHGVLAQSDVELVRQVIANEDPAPTVSAPPRVSRPPEPSPLRPGQSTAVTGRPTGKIASARRPATNPGLPDIESLADGRKPSFGSGRTPAVMSATSGKYVSLEPLGRGGMGQVMLAKDRDLRRNVAVKTLLNAGDPEHLEKFFEEAQITGQLEHPNIVPIYELGTNSDGPYLVMKRVQGETLLDLIERQRHDDSRPLSTEELRKSLDLFTRVAQAIAYAHHHGVIHRDIKPSNVMVGRFGEVLVLDWGLAKILSRAFRADPTGGETLKTDGSTRDDELEIPDDDSDDDQDVSTSELTISELRGTQDGQVKGSPAWMAPEQARGDIHEIDERADVFALGALLYHQLTLLPPFTGKTTRKVLSKAARCAYKPPRRRAPDRRIPRELDAIICKAMAPRPDGRYGSVNAMLDDLEAFRSFQSLSALPDDSLARVVKWSRRNPRISLAAALLIVFVSVGSAVGSISAQQVASADARAAQIEQEGLRAQADAAEAESRAERKEQERLRAVADAAMAKSRAAVQREAHVRELAKSEQWQELARLINATIQEEREAVLREYAALWKKAKERGEREFDFIASLPAGKKARYLACLNEHLENWVRDPQSFHVTPQDWYVRAVLRVVMNADYEGSIADYTQAIELADPDWPKLSATFNNRGAARINLEQTSSTYWTYRNRSAWGEMGMIPRTRLDKAVKDFDRALELDPENASAFHNRGLVKYLKGEFEAAVPEFEEAMQLDPRRVNTFHLCGKAHEEVGHFEKAIACFASAVELREDTDLINALGRARALFGQHAEAIADFDRAIKLDPTNAAARSNRGYAYHELGQPAQAEKNFREALDLDKHCWEASEGLGRVLLKLNPNQPSRALDRLLDAHRDCDNPVDRKKIADLIRGLGGRVPDRSD